MLSNVWSAKLSFKSNSLTWRQGTLEWQTRQLVKLQTVHKLATAVNDMQVLVMRRCHIKFCQRKIANVMYCQQQFH